MWLDKTKNRRPFTGEAITVALYCLFNGGLISFSNIALSFERHDSEALHYLLKVG